MLFVIVRAQFTAIATMLVELIYTPDGSNLVRKMVPYTVNLTVGEVIQHSQIAAAYPEVLHCAVGIFARVVQHDHLVHPGDRVEIYRPLLIDPKEKRRQRAKARL